MEGASFMAVHKKEAVLWHQRLGHPSYGSLSTLSSLYGFELHKELCDCCDVCHRAKQTRNSFSLSNSKAIRPFGLIHCDLWGRYHTPSYSGCHYFLCIVDDYSRAMWVFLLKDKSETYKCLVNFWDCKVKTQFDFQIQRVRSDNGAEFTKKKAIKGILC